MSPAITDQSKLRELISKDPALNQPIPQEVWEKIKRERKEAMEALIGGEVRKFQEQFKDDKRLRYDRLLGDLEPRHGGILRRIKITTIIEETTP